MLTELHTHTTTNAPDVPSTKCTLQFLEACNLMFERGLLHHSGVISEQHEILTNIDKGYAFFCTWLTDVIEKGTFWFGLVQVSYTN